MQYLYSILAIIALVGGVGFFYWREAKKAGYQKARVEDHDQHEKALEESVRKRKHYNDMCRTRRTALRDWWRLRKESRNRKAPPLR